jgi:hypothetical protein
LPFSLEVLHCELLNRLGRRDSKSLFDKKGCNHTQNCGNHKREDGIDIVLDAGLIDDRLEYSR